MKLQDLAVTARTKQIAKVMESHFGQEVNFSKLTRPQARNMLNRVRAMIGEARRQPGFHSSEQSPAYLKLVMMEQGLSSRISEQTVVPATSSTVTANPAQASALQSAQVAQQKRAAQDQIKQIDAQIAALQKQKADAQKRMNMPAMENKYSLRQRLKEASEVQQAQVVLASQDMVDQVQKMIEQVTSMQYKDLPALVDQIKNEVGVEQSTQFNTDATSALAGLVQNLQGSKQQLESALGVVTGQAPTVPGAELEAEPAVDLGAESLPPEEEVSAELDVEEPSSLETTLGRGKR